MFKRKYVKMRSERVIEKLENFLNYFSDSSHLTPEELYAFRYSFGDSEVDIDDSRIIKKIKLNDILSSLYHSAYIIYSDEGFACNTGSKEVEVCSKLDKRILFIHHDSADSRIIKEILVYEPSKRDSMFHITGINNGNEVDFIENFKNTDLIKYHLQDGVTVETNELNFEKEFFTFTKLNINGSTITLHYVP